MTDETIQQDVPAATEAQTDATAAIEAPRVEEAVNHAGRREQRMAAVAEKRKAERDDGMKAAAQMANPELTDEEYDAQLASRNVPDPIESEGDDQLGQKGANLDEVNGRGQDENGEAGDSPAAEEQPKTRKLKVNGQILEMTEEEYERQLSKDLAGDLKLREAALRDQQLRDREAELQRREQALIEKPPAPGANSPDVRAAVKQTVEAIYAGEADAAEEKLMELLESGRQTSTPNLEDLINQTATRTVDVIAQQRRNESAQRGWERFSTEFSDIVQSAPMTAAADVFLKEVLTEAPEMSPEDAIVEAGNRTRKLYQQQGAAPAAPQPSQTDAERIQRKANLTRVPQSNVPAEKREVPAIDMSAAAKIARMRGSRARAS